MRENLKNCYQKLPFEFYIQNYKIIFIFLFPIFGVIYNQIRERKAKRTEFFFLELYFISYLFSFIPYLIEFSICRPKKNNNTDEINDLSHKSEISILNQTIELIHTPNTKRKNFIKSIIFIIFLCGVSIAFRHFDYEATFDKKTIGLVYKIPILFLLSYLILKYKYYKQHFITLGFNILTLLTKYILSIIQSNSGKYVKEHLWKYFLFALCHSILLISGKYFMEKYRKTPYYLMLFIGIINSFILIAIATIKYLITSESEIFSGFSNYITSFPTFLIFMADIISQFIYNLGSWITVYYFTPLHTIISENVQEIYYMYDFKSNIEYWEEQGFYWNMWVIPSVLVINLICSLIFNEIIILKCFKCDYYTRIRIEEREKKETKNFLELDDKDDNDDNDNINKILSEDDNEPEIL